MTKRVALYCRISEDRSGRREGVEAQERWGRDYAASAWPDMPVEVFSDNDVSAASGDHRPGFEALRAAIRRGEVAHLWVVEQTRLERREVEWFTLAAELDAAGIGELHTNRDGIVQVRDEVAGIKAVLAAGEVRKLRRRVNDRLALLAAEGRPSSANPYGYRHGRDAAGVKTLEVVPEEAAVIRDAAEKALAGWSLSRIAADLTGRGLKGKHGGKITCDTVRSMVTNASVAGLRVYQGRIVGRAVWQPILDEETWHAVRHRLSTPRVVDRLDGTTYAISMAPRTSARRYLLTGGTAECGSCGFPLIGSVKQLTAGKVRPYYMCHKRTGGQACIGIMGDGLEAYVVAELLDALDRPAFLDALGVDEHADRRDTLTAALRDLDAQRNDLAAMWAARELTAEEWRTARRALAELEQKLRAELAVIPPSVARVDPALIRQGWIALNLDERREIIGMFVDRVIVKRAKPGTRGFDKNRVDIVWQTR
jgi:DNA invertase Pin-like site-specific DNA recombinase